MFFYAGHGSQEPCPAEFRHLEPDLLSETLVLADSRTGGGRDLVDKELAALLAEVAASGGHVVVVLDCCHAGSGTRDAAMAEFTVRRTAMDPRPRSSYDHLRDVPDPPHVLLAACRDSQTAKETVVNGMPRGAFSAALQRVLADRADLSYEEIVRWVGAGLRNRVPDQTAVLETGGGASGALRFLDDARSPAGPLWTASYRRHRGWVRDAGLVQGIPDPATAIGGTEVELYPLGGAAARVATGLVRGVGTVEADLDLVGDADPDVTYRVELLRVAAPAVTVGLAVGTAERAALGPLHVSRGPAGAARRRSRPPAPGRPAVRRRPAGRHARPARRGVRAVPGLPAAAAGDATGG